MKLIVSTNDECVNITVEEARLDAAIATRFKDRMREIVSKEPMPVKLDMQQVIFMDSSGLGAMIAVHKAMPDGSSLVLEGLTPNVDRVFRLTRMDSVFTIVPASDQEREAS